MQTDDAINPIWTFWTRIAISWISFLETLVEKKGCERSGEAKTVKCLSFYISIVDKIFCRERLCNRNISYSSVNKSLTITIFVHIHAFLLRRFVRLVRSMTWENFILQAFYLENWIVQRAFAVYPNKKFQKSVHN